MYAYEIMNSQVNKVKENGIVRSVIEKFKEHSISGLSAINDRNEIVDYIDRNSTRYISKH